MTRVADSPKYSRNVTTNRRSGQADQLAAETICQIRSLFRETGEWLERPGVSLYDRHTFLHGHGLSALTYFVRPLLRHT
jgi:hypothetical protein